MRESGKERMGWGAVCPIFIQCGSGSAQFLFNATPALQPKKIAILLKPMSQFDIKNVDPWALPQVLGIQSSCPLEFPVLPRNTFWTDFSWFPCQG